MLDTTDSRSDETLITLYATWLSSSRGPGRAVVNDHLITLWQWAVHLNGRGVLNATKPGMELFVTRSRGEESKAPDSKMVSSEVEVLRVFYLWCWDRGWTEENLARHLDASKVPHGGITHGRRTVSDGSSFRDDDTMIAIYMAWVMLRQPADEAHVGACRHALKQFGTYLGNAGLLNATEPMMELFVSRARDELGSTRDVDAATADAIVLSDFYQWCCEESWTDRNLAKTLRDAALPPHVRLSTDDDDSGESNMQAQIELRLRDEGQQATTAGGNDLVPQIGER